MSNIARWPSACWIVALFLIAGACSKPPLLERRVSSETADAFQAFRASVLVEFGAAALEPFDVAVQELKLDAMNAGVAGAAKREAVALERIHEKRVREALILGWQARHRRLTRELADMQARYDHDRQLRAKAEKSDSVTFFDNLLKNEQDLIAQISRDRKGTEEQLASWSAVVAP